MQAQIDSLITGDMIVKYPNLSGENKAQIDLNDRGQISPFQIQHISDHGLTLAVPASPYWTHHGFPLKLTVHPINVLKVDVLTGGRWWRAHRWTHLSIDSMEHQ